MSSYLEEQMGLLKFDKRLLEINFKNGSLSEEEYKKYLESLEDDVDKAEELGFHSDNKSQGQEGESLDQPSDSMDDTNKENSEPDADISPDNDYFGSGY